jgi:effector-binding domain-containing protein
VPDVDRVRVDPQPTAVVRAHSTQADLPRDIISSLDQVYAAVRQGLVAQQGQNVVLYLNGPNSIEVGIEVAGAFEAVGAVGPSTLPGGEVARALHVGPYDQLGVAHDAVQAWCKEHGLALAGPSWEIYGDWEEDPSKLTTEVRYLLAPTAPATAT